LSIRNYLTAFDNLSHVAMPALILKLFLKNLALKFMNSPLRESALTKKSASAKSNQNLFF
jgi:hypothetical protein